VLSRSRFAASGVAAGFVVVVWLAEALQVGWCVAVAAFGEGNDVVDVGGEPSASAFGPLADGLGA
jgi:hypothetical protein